MKQIFIILFSITIYFTYGQGNCIYQAEAGTNYQNYVSLENENSINFNVTVSATRAYNINIRYKCNGDQRNRVNGISELFQQSYNFRNKSISLNLNQGNNTITISKQWGWMDVDYIEIIGCNSINNVGIPPISITYGSSCTYQAEAGTNYQNYVSLQDENSIQFNVTVPTSFEAYGLTIRYKCNGNQRNKVNGKSVLFQQSYSFTNHFMYIPLRAGNNTITIEKEWGWMDVDYIKIGGCNNNKLANKSEQGALTLFPNPLSANSLTLTLSGLNAATGVQVSIYDIDGAELYTKSVISSSSVELTDIPDLDSGVYMVRAVANNLMQHAKLTIQ